MRRRPDAQGRAATTGQEPSRVMKQRNECTTKKKTTLALSETPRETPNNPPHEVRSGLKGALEAAANEKGGKVLSPPRRVGRKKMTTNLFDLTNSEND